ncbi:hypothetical protein RUM43_006389 [Polyplax serrata]|uniref:Methyltransferase NSUN7 n=1 Tax=Polyplax serrata TaxID=468196 RepID=A0AAN8PL72_POLSC
MPPDDTEESPKWEQVVVSQPEMKKAKMSGSSSIGSESSVITTQPQDISWNALDLGKAASLLGSNSREVTFQDEEEMRRVFALLYDVFRYKYILSEALRETGFLQKYPQHQKDISLVWLLFYDLHKRRFLPRVHAEAIVSAETFEKVGLVNIERDLWASRIKLAASLARLRIKNNALRLNQLLPLHLRDERFVSIEETPVTGWINTFKKSKKEICDSIEKLGLRLQSKHETVLTKNDFRFDHLCPKLLLCHPIQRPELAQSPLIRDHTVILQDRAFCIGPALMGKILTEIPLRGTIAQTHVNTPRTTAYFANVLAENDRLEKLVAFGAGDKLLEYQTYIHDLGINNCEIYAQRFADLHPEAAVLENLVAVLATPPNSYTGVTDPVDLICSRGGDMNMLKGLTQMEVREDSLGYLDEQRETLKYCMSLPQVQIILYETHSIAPEENFEMVNSVISKVNDMAKEKHEEEHRLILEREEAEEKLNKPIFIPGKPSSREQREKEAQEAREAAPPKEVEVPPCDLFEVVSLPDLCSHGPNCFSDEGCFLAKIQRKEIISLDAKYMIKIAEARGLFGTELGKKKVPAARVTKKPERRRTSSAKIKIRKVKLEIDRLAAPTQSTIYRTKRESSPFNWSSPSCPRHQSHTLETINKCEQGDADDLSARSMERRNSRSRRNQEESVRRLSKPLTRRLTSPDSFSSEVKARFWRYATAKSVEDLIRTLKKKRRGKRIFKLEDYFFFKEQEIYIPQHHKTSLLSNSGETNFFQATPPVDVA